MNTRDSLTIYIGGEAGQGLATVGEFLIQGLAKGRYNFLSWQGYESRIRGGHNTFSVRISPRELTGPDEGAGVVLALDAATEEIDGPRLRPGGMLLAVSPDAKAPKGVEILRVPYADLATPRELNMAALGVLAALLDIPYDLLGVLVDLGFKGKSEGPLGALKNGFEWAAPKVGGRFRVKNPEGSGLRLLINGNEALALGAAAAGINFCSFYPMSPGTSIALSLAAWGQEAGIIVEQAEDEIAAVNMALGAAYAGAPALVNTSGGGFALMCEGVSLAGMTETPIVIAVVQRPGPATGLPTRTAQGDLNLVLYAGHGEFPRAILAPADSEECFHLAAHAAHLAEESQGPVFILSDQFLADAVRPIKPFDFGALRDPVNPTVTHHEICKALGDGRYERYAVTPDGLSPRLLPGLSSHLVKLDSDEHTPDGHLTEDLDVRVTMQEKRMRKEAILRRQALPPDYQGEHDPDLLLVSWGSSKGAMLDALAELMANGRSVGLLHFNQLYPLSSENFLPRLLNARRVVIVEGNQSGQFAQLLRRETGFKPHALISRYDGLPLSCEYILKSLEG